MTTGVMQIEDCLLEGHLGITKELVAMQSVQKRFYIGAENGGCGLIKVCIVSYLSHTSSFLAILSQELTTVAVVSSRCVLSLTCVECRYSLPFSLRN